MVAALAVALPALIDGIASEGVGKALKRLGAWAISMTLVTFGLAWRFPSEGWLPPVVLLLALVVAVLVARRAASMASKWSGRDWFAAVLVGVSAVSVAVVLVTTLKTLSPA
jgi:hypothetical protein